MRHDAEAVGFAKAAERLDASYGDFAAAAVAFQAFSRMMLTDEPKTGYEPIVQGGARALPVLKRYCKGW